MYLGFQAKNKKVGNFLLPTLKKLYAIRFNMYPGLLTGAESNMRTAQHTAHAHVHVRQAHIVSVTFYKCRFSSHSATPSLEYIQ